MSADTDDEDLDLPNIESDAASTGAAADSSNDDERFQGLPRLLRYAMLGSESAKHIEQRLVAEINELCPGLPQNALWASTLEATTAAALAAELDRMAVTQDKPVLRSLADSVRLVSLPLPRDLSSFDEYRRVGKALIEAFRKLDRRGAGLELCSEIEEFVYGWAGLPACTDLLSQNISAAKGATIVGARMAEYRPRLPRLTCAAGLRRRQKSTASRSLPKQAPRSRRMLRQTPRRTIRSWWPASRTRR